MRFTEIQREYLLLKKRKSKRTYESAKYHVGKLMEFFANKKLSAISARTWLEYEEFQPTKRALNHDRVHMVAILRYAHSQGYIKFIPTLPSYTPHQNEGYVLSLAQFKQMLGRCKGPEEKLVIALAFYMGMRKSEILKLTWDRVCLKKQVLTLRREDTKTRRPRMIPLHPECLKIFNRLRPWGRFVFPGKCGLKARTDFKRPWDRIRDTIPMRFHDLRHSFITHAVDHGLPALKIAKFAGMGIRTLDKIYLHLQYEQLRSINKIHSS